MQKKQFNFTSNSKMFRNLNISKCLLKKALLPSPSKIGKGGYLSI